MDFGIIQKTVLGILVILAVATLFATFFIVVFWIIAKILKWILSLTPAQRVLFAIQQTALSWWERHHLYVGNLWESTYELFIDPVFFAYAVFILFNRIAFLTDYTAQHPEYNFWQLLILDMEHNVSLYNGFLAVFFIWMLGKVWTHRQHIREQRATTKVLL